MLCLTCVGSALFSCLWCSYIICAFSSLIKISLTFALPRNVDSSVIRFKCKLSIYLRVPIKKVSIAVSSYQAKAHQSTMPVNTA